ncbi:MAG TPA: BrnT family toxin [Rhizomicrobium sp.]
MNEIEFDWDPRKSEANRRKHGIDFVFATRVFADPLRSTDIEGDEHGEVRWWTVGEIDGRVFRVTYAIREEGKIEVYRLISARKATPRENEIYREAP